jgi:PEP-CTERM motif
MKQKNLLAALAATMSLSTVANAALITSFTNLDFDSGAVTTPGPFVGFDAPAATEIAGWTNTPGTLVDSGVEAVGAWWSPYQVNSAFLRSGDGAYNLSTYTIGAGDVFDISMYAKSWNFAAAGAQLTVTLFYGSDPNLNLIGSFSTGALSQSGSEAWTQYTSGSISATAGSIGQTLGLKVVSDGPAGSFGNFDEIQVNVIPEPSTALLGGLGMLALLRRRR